MNIKFVFRLLFWTSVALVLVASGGLTCEQAGDTRLLSLELEVEGVNQLAFDPDLRVYDLWLPAGATTATIRAEAYDPDARVNWYVPDCAGNVPADLIGIGGGEVTVDLPPDGCALYIGVFPPGQAVNTYIIPINAVCPAGDPCYNGGIPGTCAGDVCVRVSFCDEYPIDCGASSECLTDGICDPLCDPSDAASGLCSRCPGKDNPVPNGTSCGTDGVCEDGSCRERGWGTAELIETNDDGKATFALVAMDAGGNAVAVWEQNDGTTDNLWSNRYTVDSGWGTPELIETDPGNASWLQHAVDADGNALAVWAQWDGLRFNTWANRYTVGSGWGTPELIEAGSGSTDQCEIAMDASGNATAVWGQSDGIRRNTWANRYSVGSGWGTPELLDVDDAGDAGRPQIAMDASGNAIAVWPQSDGIRYNMWANRYSVGSGWEAAERIEMDDSGTVRRAKIAMDASGNATAVWRQSDGIRYNIWANRYSVGSGWGAPELIELDNAGSADGSEVAMDPSGNATAMWHQYDGTRNNVWANRYTVGIGWGDAELVEMATGNATFPKVVMDASGNATAVWEQYGGVRDDVWASRYLVGQGWGTPELLESNPGDGSYLELATDASGNAIAIWSQLDTIRYNIWANRFE